MKFFKTFVAAVMITVIMASCSDTVTDETDWLDIYSKVLSGQNELEIDFANYNVGDETDVTKIRNYQGCGLYDLDANGVPELFVSVWLWEGGFYHLFTIDGDAGKYVGQSYGSLVEKSTGVLFNVDFESGYTPNIAYEYADGSLVEIPDYVKPVYSQPIGDYSEVSLGEKILNLDSEDIVQIKIYDSLDEAASNYNTVP